VSDTKETLDGPVGTKSYWTTVNAGEALPGIITPLNWSWYDRPAEVAQFGVFKAFGVLPRNLAISFEDFDQRFTSVFFGRYVINIDTWRRVSDLTPGTSGDIVERQFFGNVRPGIQANRSARRHGIVAVKLPWAILTSRGKMLRSRAAIAPWWQENISELHTADTSRALEIMFEAHQRFAEVQATHLLCSIIAGIAFQNLAQLAQKAGMESLIASLAAGYGLEETASQDEIWSLSRGLGGTLKHIVTHYGFTGPGEIARPSWREDESAILGVIERFRALPEDKRPAEVAARQRKQREDAERRLLAALPWSARWAAKLVLKIGRSYMPLRESGRAALLHGLDVGRAAANVIGRKSVASGALERADDIFYLSMEEIREMASARGLPTAQQMVAARRERREYYKSITLPLAWIGQPAVANVKEFSVDLASEIKGICVTRGYVTGRARVILDPTDADDFEVGEVLVCPTSDPSWASLFIIASGVVIDIGGPLSHAAVIARELGIPCVINTGSGTRQIATGDQVRVDADKGVVEILQRKAAATPAVVDIRAAAGSPKAEAPSSGGTLSLHFDAALQLTRLKGRLKHENLATTLGIGNDAAAALLAELVAAGDCTLANDTLRVTASGREHLSRLINNERANVDHEVIQALYNEFDPFNIEIKALVTRWQIRDGKPNDHGDAKYDQRILDGVASLDVRFRPILDRVVKAAPRLSHYAGRFERSMQKMRAGDHTWLARPVIDSYHTVWFELHEDLIGLIGRSRAAEAAAGRAD
jgi:pyruvate,water dikinase